MSNKNNAENEEVAKKDPIAELVARISKVEEENKMLKEIAGKSAMADWADKNKEVGVRTAHFKVIDGKTVIAWKTTKNEVKKINGIFTEDIKVEIVFIDGQSKEIDLVDLVRCSNQVVCRVVSQNGDSADMEMPDGTRFSTKIKYWNA
jgi:hypothetical protein